MPDNENLDGIGRDIEVMEKNMEDMAKVAFSYFTALQDAGFEVDSAFTLARDWHQIFWNATHSTKGKGE